jgi:hypothetical protein
MKVSLIVSSFAALTMTALFAAGCSGAPEEENDASEGAATEASALCSKVASSEGYLEIASAPIFDKLPTKDDKRVSVEGVCSGTANKALCASYANRKLFHPAAGHVAFQCIKLKNAKAPATDKEIKECGVKGLNSVCNAANFFNSHEWCESAIVGPAVATLGERVKSGNGLQQACRYRGPGLAELLRSDIKTCFAGKLKGSAKANEATKLFNECVTSSTENAARRS